ncbi:MAG: hypothetical protein J6P09_00310 [Methanobrevibacter sp.]|nr:hypothetical protein [Methanobrevibacter sp.]
MNFMNNNANIKQFQLIKFINENCSEDHVVSKISIVLRRDKIEAPYYMDINVKISSCLDRLNNGLIHAMDMLNYNRRHNLTEEKYNEIESLIVNSFDEDANSERVNISKTDEKIKMVLTSINDEDFRNIFKNCQELFDVIDNLID